MPRETPLIAATAALLGLLLWSIWRIPMTTTATAVLLYVIGGALEAGGVITVAVDLHESWRRGRKYGRWSRTLVVPAEGEAFGAADDIEERLWRLEHVLGVEEFRLTGWLGFFALLLGVLVGTAANIISATD